MGDLQDWIGFNMNNSVTWNCEGVWNVFWAMACYLLWSLRNKELNIDGYMRPNRPAQQVRKMMIEYTQAMQNNSIVVNRTYSAWQIIVPLGCSLNFEITTFDNCPSHMHEIYDVDCMGIGLLPLG
jgi:hypothetical protein